MVVPMTSTIKLKNSTKLYFKKAKLKEAIINEIQLLPDFSKDDMKYDSEIIEFVLSTVVNKFRNKKKVDIKDFAIDILKQLFSLSADEIAIVTKTVVYLLENKIVKKNSLWYKYGSLILEYVLKKV